MKKAILIVACVLTAVVVAFVGYVIYDVEVANKDWGRTVDREIMVSSGNDMVKNRDEIQTIKSQFDCENYNYGFETEKISCEEGVKRLLAAAETEVALGELYQGFEANPLPREHLEKTITASESYLKALDAVRDLNAEFLAKSEIGLDDQYAAIRDNADSFRKILE